MKANPTRPRLSVTGGKGVVSHAGARLLCELADDLGLTEHLSVAMAPTKKRLWGHDRGEVLVNLAVALADGATAISDVRVLPTNPTFRRGGLGPHHVAHPRGHGRRRHGAHRQCPSAGPKGRPGGRGETRGSM